MMPTPLMWRTLAPSTPTRAAPPAGALRRRFPAGLDPGAAAGPALVAGEAAVAGDHRDAAVRNVELVGDDLADRDIDALAHVHLAEERRDMALAVDGDPRIELARMQWRPALWHWPALADLGQRSAGRGRHGDGDDERAGGLQQRATGNRPGPDHCHGGLPHAIALAARFTARRIAICVPQRHLMPLSASPICSSLGFFVRLRNDAAVMIQPLTQ